MSNKIRELLENYGLEKKEIDVYACLVSNKELTAYQLAKELRIHRSTTYDILERLIVKGFVNKTEKNGKKFYSSTEISAILGKLKDKENLLLSLIPEVEKVEKAFRTEVRILEGEEGHKQFDFNIFNLARQNQVSYLYIIGNSSAENLSTEIFIKKILKEIKEKKIHKKIDYKGLWSYKYRGNPIVKQYFFGENLFLEGIPSEVTTIIFDNYVGYIFYSDKKQVLEIRSRQISEEMKSYFLNLWKMGEKGKNL